MRCRVTASAVRSLLRSLRWGECPTCRECCSLRMLTSNMLVMVGASHPVHAVVHTVVLSTHNMVCVVHTHEMLCRIQMSNMSYCAVSTHLIVARFVSSYAWTETRSAQCTHLCHLSPSLRIQALSAHMQLLSLALTLEHSYAVLGGTESLDNREP